MPKPIYTEGKRSRKPRKYQPIWEQIKLHSTASVAAEPCIHRRLIKAVRKEKDEDTGWKFLMAEKGKKYKLLETVEGKLITFRLVDVSPISIYSI